jgi:hypothetical protein
MRFFFRPIAKMPDLSRKMRREKSRARSKRFARAPLTSCAALFAAKLEVKPMALAYFITFTTYGTWLPGNAKGSVHDEHNVFATPLLEADAKREQLAQMAMKEPPYVMSAAEREIVCKAIVGLAVGRGWELLAQQVRTNHVHAVARAELEPGRMMSDMKGRASRELTLAGFGVAASRRWTRHGSTRHLFRGEQVAAAIRYPLDEQGERMAWYSPEPRKEPRTN